MKMRAILPSLFVFVSVIAMGLPSAVLADTGSEEEPKIDAHKEFSKANDLASRNALTLSIPHYQKVCKFAADRYPSAHFNLAQVWRSKTEYAKAIFHFQAYLHLGEDRQTLKEAKAAIDDLVSRYHPGHIVRLSVDIEPEAQSKLYIDGFLFTRGRDVGGSQKGAAGEAAESPDDKGESKKIEEGIRLIAGTYDLRAEVVDHHPDEETVTMKRNTSGAAVSLRPELKTFYGEAVVDVDQEGATVKLHPEELKSPKGPDEPIVKKSPIEKPIELVTGKYLLEVTKSDFDRWVRYIHIRRNEQNRVDVSLSRKLPEEIR